MRTPVEEAARLPERRSLAAILFTDVVAFSRHAAIDEPRTFAAMNRDFALFTQLCGEHSGRVANTAGDSMLLIFGSAVDAMECALAIQAELYRQAKSHPPEGVLEHRIGVHIGDVMHDGTNVMGDGVNVASRIQEICRPGAIAYSRAVSEIVSGKVATHGIYLGPRRAKNIGDAIPVWEVPALIDPERQRQNAELIGPLATSPAAEGLAGGRAVAAVALAGVLLAAGFAILTTIRMSGGPARPPVTSKTKPEQKPSTNSANEASNASANASTNGASTNASPSAGATDLMAQAEETRRRIEEMKARYDFDGIIALLERVRDEPVASSLGPATIGPALEHYRLLSSLKVWTDTELRFIPVATPLDLGDGTTIENSNGTPMIFGNDMPSTPLSVWNLTPPKVLTLVSALDARSDRGSPAPAGAIAEFAREYGLPVPSSAN